MALRRGGIAQVDCVAYLIMLDTKDIQMLERMFGKILAEGLRANNEVFGSQLKREIRDEMRALLSASETRIMKKAHEIKVEIIDGITDVLDEGVLPRLDEHDREIRVIKRHLKLA